MFEIAFKEIVIIEGGYVNDPLDKGGETKWGISFAVARAAGYRGEIKDMPLDLAKLIYRKNYWDALNLDAISNLSYPIAAELFDTGVNMGIGVAAKFIQRGLNVFFGANSVFIDGRIGSVTISYLKQYCEDPKKSAATMLKILNAQQCVRYLDIVESNRNQTRFLRGWIDKRVSIGS